MGAKTRTGRESDGTGIDAVLAELNDRQRDAVTHGDSPLLIIAGAGTGKTTTLAHRVAYLMATGTDPGRILLLTFTRRAAAEMLRRIDDILSVCQHATGSGGKRRSRIAGRIVWGGTFHSVAARVLRQHGRLIGLDAEFTILDRGDAEDLLNVLRADLGLTKTETRFPLKGTCLDIYSRCMSTQQSLETVVNSSFPWCLDEIDGLKQLFQAYGERKESDGVLDYDDLLAFWRALLSEPAAAEVIRGRFDCVLVDEYQDTNLLQAEILRNLSPDGQGLTVVGDDAQSIYSFRAATVRNILDFPDIWPGTTVVTLEKNYRSTQPILDLTNGVIAQATERHAKELWSARGDGAFPVLVDCPDESEQTDFVIDQILEHRETGIELKRQAVLFRASHHSLALEVELSRRNIPFHKYGGLKFIETAHVKDLLAFLKLAENPRDSVSGTRVLMLLPGIGHKKSRQLLDRLAEARYDFSVWDDQRVPSATANDWPGFVGLMKTLSGRAGRSPRSAGKQPSPLPAEVHAVRTVYTPLLERRHDHAAARLRDLEQLEQVAARFADRRTFLAEITLDPPSSTQELPGQPLLDDDYLVLSTIHSAKGLEWDAVYVIHAADGNIPSDMATGSDEEIEEERRLFYVALTRARDHLYICRPERYYFHARFHSDAHSLSQLTRFLPVGIQPLLERRFAGTVAPLDDFDNSTTGLSTADIRRKMGKRLWS